MSKPTMRDIGREIGVSAVTVSKALAGKAGMSDELRESILKKAEEMGYRYPERERGRPKELDIGILVPERYFEEESFYAGLYKRLVKRLTERGHFGLLEILNREAEDALEAPGLVRSRRISGLILLGQPLTKAYCRMLAQIGVPLLFLDFYDEQASADAVVGDNAYGCYRLTSHLIHLGHTRIGFVGSRLATSSIMDRYLGYCRAMLSHNLPMREDWVLPDRDSTGRVLDEITLPADMPTAFVCNCDLVAEMVVSTLRAGGLRIPEDISVTGFDDYVGASRGEPWLSTFRVDLDAMVSLAVKTLEDRCAGLEKPFGRTVIGGQPIYRKSEKPI